MKDDLKNDEDESGYHNKEEIHIPKNLLKIL